ncbi:MAG TPA: hypothetical protein VGL89_17345 [Candidatus Koribacter sp.]|jgi:hypothetical protein
MFTKKFRAAALMALVMAVPALAQKGSDDLSPEDTAAIHDYVLTMARVKVYQAASQDYEKGQHDPAMEAESKKVEANDVSLMSKVKMVETSCPRMNAWIKAHGMTAREFVVLPMTLMTAGLAQVAINQGGKPPAWVNPANIAFVKAHKDELDKLGALGGGR